MLLLVVLEVNSVIMVLFLLGVVVGYFDLSDFRLHKDDIRFLVHVLVEFSKKIKLHFFSLLLGEKMATLLFACPAKKRLR